MLIFSQLSRSSRKRPSRHAGGFTLIELLGVIAIIGVLTSIIFTSVSSARVTARDGQRLKDLDTIQAAVELYYRDYGHYPITAGAACGTSGWASFDATSYKDNLIKDADGTCTSASTLTTALASYLPNAPKDPKKKSNNDAGYLYWSDATGSSYRIMIFRSPENMGDIPAKNIDMSRCVAITNGQCTNGGTGANNNICYSSAGVTSSGYFTC